MPNNLVIVESPAKAKTIARFLGDDYKVLSSYGHIRDLHKKDFSIDIDHDFKPLYEIPDDKKHIVENLKKAAKSATTVWLASDEDREGEAIAWHLSEVLRLKPEATKRIVFHEITKPAILAAIESPRDIDLNLVDAQQARRVLDRIVGFELSPVLWKKIKPALSAGRVQSVAVRLVAEREKEINKFKSEPYYRVTAILTAGEAAVDAELNRRFADRDEALALLEHCKTATFTVLDVSTKPLKKNPAPPFTTSTLQQEAARKLGFSVSQTMRVAQSLYEAGHITYMRTDSVNLSKLALGTIAGEIEKEHGKKYLHVRNYHTTSKGAQEAHEAIRPTFISNHDIEGTAQEKRLYQLIWRRTLASQMAEAEIERSTMEVAISDRDDHFTATGEVVTFDGFLKVYAEEGDDDKAQGKNSSMALPPMRAGMQLAAQEVVATQRFTQQPPRYSEAALVRRLEELGIGRPSTYAPTISTIQTREYVVKGENKGEKQDYELITLKKGKIASRTKSETRAGDKGRLLPTDIGMVVNDFLMEYFPQIMDYNFTAQVESDFDDIAAGKASWNAEIKKFYKGFHANVEGVSKMRLEHKVGERQLGTDPKSGKPVSVKIGRFGPVVQLGSTEGSDKPRFAPLEKGQSVNTLTLQEALKLFEMPRSLGEYEGQEITVSTGRFGPYVKHGGIFVSIPKDISPYAITRDEAVALIVDKRASEAKKVIKTFDEEPDMQVLNGRYGPYISYAKSNYKIPKGKNAEALTLEECREIVANEGNATKKRAPRRAARAKK